MKDKNINISFVFKDFIVFILLFFATIGSKQIYNYLEEGDIVFTGVISISLVLTIFFIKHPKLYSRIYFTFLIFYIYLLISSLLPLHLEYGFYKSFLGLFIPIFLFKFIYNKEWTEQQLQQYFVISVVVISSIAIVYKLRYGLYNRSVSFGLLGPIPFGWVNGMALLAITLKRDKKIIDYIFIAFFFLMLIWSGSKGPLVAFFAISFFFFRRILGDKLSTKIIVVLLIMGGAFFVKTYSEDIRAIRTITRYIEDPEGYTEGAGKGSFGTREIYLNHSLNLFEENPILGIGFGGWSDSIPSGHKYPHNIYAELLSETGLIGVILFLAMLSTLKFRSIFGYMGIFGLICLSFSGDFSYIRYAIFPILISTFIIKKNKTLQENSSISLNYK